MGVITGLLLAFLSIGMFVIIMSSPISSPPDIPPVTEALVNNSFLPISSFFSGELPYKKVTVHTKQGGVLNNWKEGIGGEILKENVKINLVEGYPIGPQRTVGISGQGLEGSTCALYLNDKLYDATTCINGSFFFPRVTVMPGQNIIEVIAYELNGRCIPSNMIEVFVDSKSRIIEKGKNITRGNIKYRKVSITFDGGASASCAPEILDTLNRFKLKCTFFLTGDFIRNHPGIVKKMVQSGHEIGNHTDTHPHLANLDSELRFRNLPWVNREFIYNQLKKAEEAFFRLTGKRMAPYWRAPYGEHSLDIRKWAEEIGYIHIGWTCGRVLEEGLDTLDWVYNSESPIYYSAEDIRDKIIYYGRDEPEGVNGGIILMHLASSRPVEDRIHYQLPVIIKGLQKRGYRLSTISEILDFNREKEVAANNKKPSKSSASRSKGELGIKPDRRSGRRKIFSP